MAQFAYLKASPHAADPKIKINATMSDPREERRMGVQGYLRSTGFNLAKPRGYLIMQKKMSDLVTNMLSKAGAQRIPHEIKIVSTFNQNPLKNEPLHVARGPVFSATDDVFSVTGHVFEASGRGAAPECQKGEREGCFWSPRGEPFWSKSAKKSPGVAQKDPEIRKRPSQNR